MYYFYPSDKFMINEVQQVLDSLFHLFGTLIPSKNLGTCNIFHTRIDVKIIDLSLN